MASEEEIRSYRAKAREEIAGAQSEYEHGRFNNCVKLAYYACFHAAVAELLGAGVAEPPGGGIWGHAFVQAEFVRRFVQRRKQYPASLGDTLSRALAVRDIADYRPAQVSRAQATRALRQATEFLSALTSEEGEQR